MNKLKMRVQYWKTMNCSIIWWKIPDRLQSQCSKILSRLRSTYRPENSKKYFHRNLLYLFVQIKTHIRKLHPILRKSSKILKKATDGKISLQE